MEHFFVIFFLLLAQNYIYLIYYNEMNFKEMLLCDAEIYYLHAINVLLLKHLEMFNYISIKFINAIILMFI